MKDGDIGGLCALKAEYGYVGVRVSGNTKYVVMVNANKETPVEIASVPISQDSIYLRIDMDFTNRTDKATFYYSFDGAKWNGIGNVLQMSYTLPHFMGYRFGLFNFGTKNSGGYVDFDFFKIGTDVNNPIVLSKPTVNTVLASSAKVTVIKKSGDTTSSEDISQIGRASCRERVLRLV